MNVRVYPTLSRILWLLAGMSLSTGPAIAGPVVPVEIRVELEGQQGTVRGAVCARALDSTGERREIRHRSDHLEEAVLGLPRNTSWEVALEATGYWARPVVVLAREQDEPQKITLQARPTGVVGGLLRVAPGEELPAEIELRFAPSPEGSSGSKTPVSGMTASVNCPVGSGGRFRCELPAQDLDFRLRARRFVSHFFWDTRVSTQKLTGLGEIELERGSSVAGVVETADGSPLPEELDLRLTPALGGRVRDASVEQRLRARALTVDVSTDGFFHFEATPPGAYSVEARAEGWATASLPVRVHEDSEVELTRALVLERPAQLDLTLEPPVDPFGNPWTVTLLEVHDLQGDLRQVKDETGHDGRWPSQTLAPGLYELTVSTAQGRRHTAWLHRQLTLESGTHSLDLEVPLVPVEGRVEMGGEPLATTLWFGGTFGAQKAGFDSDEEGRFTGYLPNEGEWAVELIEPVTSSRIRLPPVDVERGPGATTARVDLSVPDTRLTGEVVDARGDPVARAYVSINNVEWNVDRSARPNRVWTESDGTFSIWGFQPGMLSVSARTREASSEWVSVEVEESLDPNPVRLVVRRRVEVSGRVVSPHGVVPGAQIRAKARVPGSRTQEVANVSTSGDGSFRLSLPDGTDSLSMVVLAPGFAAQIVAAPVDGNRSLDVALIEDGGTLRLELPEDGGSLAHPTLEYRGARIPLGWLDRWADSTGPWVLPAMEAGDYAVCVGERCARGFLAPYGELFLSFDTDAEG